MKADLLLVNGRVYLSAYESHPQDALAIAGERVLAVGAGESLRDLLAPSGRVCDLGGRVVIPGLTDSHIHFFWYALGLRRLDLRDVRSSAEMAARVAERVRTTAPGRWIVGHGWDQEQWPDRRFPTAADLDPVSPEHPVLLIAKSGHALVANSLALRRARITPATLDPPGGHIARDAAGRPTGMLFEDGAMDLVKGLLPPPTPEEAAAALEAAFPQAWRVGLTAIHDMDGGPAFAAYRLLHGRDALGLRVVKYLPPAVLDDGSAADLRSGAGDLWLRIGGIKLFADGALGTRTAALFEPYAGEPENRGLWATEPALLRTISARAAAHDLSVAIHAIGDRAVEEVLDILAALDGPPRLRHRIEHVQLLRPSAVGRFAAQGVVASMQPIHATQDYPMAERYWGERCAYAYAWRMLWESGAVLAFGSDSPVESLDPFLGLHAAVTRRRPDGSPAPAGWRPEQRLDIRQALWAYTQGAAYAAGMEADLGTLHPGRLADLVVLDQDIIAQGGVSLHGDVPPVMATMVGGRWVYGPWS